MVTRKQVYGVGQAFLLFAIHHTPNTLHQQKEHHV